MLIVLSASNLPNLGHMADNATQSLHSHGFILGQKLYLYKYNVNRLMHACNVSKFCENGKLIVFVRPSVELQRLFKCI